jgi:hypothetical protein
MVSNLPSNIDKKLYFSISTLSDVFYQKELASIKNLYLNIHITKEKIK